LFGKDWKPVFDTDIFAVYRRHLTKNDYKKMSLSVLVLYELVARPINQDKFNLFDGWRKTAIDDNRLIVPTYDDIWTSAQAIRKMRLAEQRQHKGITPAMENATAFQNDALIARSAFKKNCFVVTANVADYEKISQFMRIRFASPQDYFGL
jgi:predicted nucleic acid-binding protein